MNTSEVLWQHIEDRGLCPGSRSLDDWLDMKWLTIKVGRRVVPILPMLGMKNAMAMHDVHHVLSGYDTSLRGEAELAVWELASGGCGFNLFFWIDRTLLFVTALILMPWRMIPAFRRGIGCRNLYRHRREVILDLDFRELQRMVDPSGKLADVDSIGRT